MATNIPYGFDCYAFAKNELRYFQPDIRSSRSAGPVRSVAARQAHAGFYDAASQQTLPGYVRFTRKNEHYTPEQLGELARAGKLDGLDRSGRSQIFCGIKIQIGIGVVTNFLKRGLQYRPPIRGRSELVNGSWTGIVSGLTMDNAAPAAYDMAFGNFLAYDEEFPYMNFGPFYAVESKLVLLTGSSRRVEASAFGTNIGARVWATVLAAMLALSLVASLRVHWQHTKRARVGQQAPPKSLAGVALNFFFIYFTMLLNKPCFEFDELIWPKHATSGAAAQEAAANRRLRRTRHRLPSSIRVLSYLWSAACLVMASIYSGELLAVILLHADTNIDTIQQLISAKPPIAPVIRQDDFTYNLMLKSLDGNMLRLHNITKQIARPDVYTQSFIESVSRRQQALLGDDELIETIYDIYHKYFPLHRSQVAYLQYPISIMYRKDLDAGLEARLRRGVVQIFEMGLIHRWYQAQKDTYIHLYDRFEKKDHQRDDLELATAAAMSGQKYKPLSMRNFYSFFQFICAGLLLALLILLAELAHHRLNMTTVAE